MKKVILFLIASLMIVGIIGCGPHKTEKFVDIESNETAFLVPLEGASKSGQSQFMSIDYLNEVKVATKRVSLPLRRYDTGRMWYSYKWIPTMRVIKVNRLPVTREWTGDSRTGTSNKDQALWVESSDSIGFGVGVNVTALVKEEDAAKFLYYFAGKPLTEVVDENVRGKVNSILSREFAKYDLEQGRSQKNTIFEEVAKETVAEYKEMGITITNLGLAEGLVYEDKDIQIAINNKFEAEMDIQIQDKKNEAQVKVNERNVAIAKALADAKIKEAQGMIAIETAKAEAAKQFASAIEARTAQVELEIRRMDAEARLTFAQKMGPGVLPSNIIPQGSGFLFGLDTPKK
jgi:regulator of protease activity HflC (stomatin/prohibitin superfamily)